MHPINPVVSLLPPGNGGGGDAQVPAVKVFAYREIVSEAGLVKAGTVGYVAKAWINRAVAGGCSCKGSTNWFRLL